MTEFDQLSKERGFDQEFEDKWRPGLRESHLFDRNAIHEIHRMAREGIYDIRGFGAKRRVPHFDDLLFLGPASRATRSRVTARSAQPTSHSAPALPRTRSSSRFRSRRRHELRRAVGAGQGGAWPRSERDGDEAATAGCCPRSASIRRSSSTRCSSRYGMNPDDLRRADAVEVGQGAKPGGGGMLLGQKISDRVAEMRDLPMGVDQRSACRHPRMDGPRRPGDQNRGAARDHGLAGADLREDRCHPHLLRRRARGQGRSRRDRARRNGGRHRRQGRSSSNTWGS